jgi:hypothetical protein
VRVIVWMASNVFEWLPGEFGVAYPVDLVVFGTERAERPWGMISNSVHKPLLAAVDNDGWRTTIAYHRDTGR